MVSYIFSTFFACSGLRVCGILRQRKTLTDDTSDDTASKKRQFCGKHPACIRVRAPPPASLIKPHGFNICLNLCGFFVFSGPDFISDLIVIYQI